MSEPLPFCTNVSRAGRHCRSRVSHLDSPYCRSHARIHRAANVATNPLAGLPPELSQFTSIEDVTRFLASLLTMLAENRISARRAAVLAYIANSLLHALKSAQAASVNSMEDEEAPEIDWTGFPRPIRDSRSDATPAAAPQSNGRKASTPSDPVDLACSGAQM
jgi:hypothetical protein